jgi:hypothetical protein
MPNIFQQNESHQSSLGFYTGETYNEVGLSLGRNEAGINDNARKEQLLFMEPIMFLKISLPIIV